MDIQDFHFISDIENLHHLPMTAFETQLTKCAKCYGKEKEHAFTAEEMSEYMTWLVNSYEDETNREFLPKDIPSMLVGTDISEIGTRLLHNPKDKAALKELTAQYETQTESYFFPKNQDITASRLLRYMPLYWHTNCYFEMYYAFAGNTPILFENETVSMTPGTVLIVPPSTVQACTCSSDDSIVFSFTLRASTFSQVFFKHLSKQNVMSLFFMQALNEDSTTPYLRFDTGGDLAVEGLLYYISCEFHSDNAYRSQMLNSLMSTFFLLLLQHYEDTAQISKRSSLLWKPEFLSLFHHIQAHYTSVTLAELSQRYNYSQRQIIRIIQNCTGKTFSKLLIQMRMEKAAQLLSSIPTPSIAEIAEHVGYSTLSSFYRTFTGYYGYTPKEYIVSCQCNLGVK